MMVFQRLCAERLCFKQQDSLKNSPELRTSEWRVKGKSFSAWAFHANVRISLPAKINCHKNYPKTACVKPSFARICSL